ncbi:hypothetical protein [Stenotrophomonas maltophilia]|uniref:hypothetical protein n=1 Tax=Stenotrophomonas maltophilia TaxID=40324 RepID=UPI001FA75C58
MRDRVIDGLHSRSAESAARGAFVVIDSVQSLGHPADQVIGLACAFKNFCEVLGLDPMEVLRIVSRMEQDCRYRQVNTLNAVRRYAERELKPHYP